MAEGLAPDRVAGPPMILELRRRLRGTAGALVTGMTKSPFLSICPSDLRDVIGGATRAASGGGTQDNNSALLTTVTQLQSSISDLAKNNQGNSSDQMMPMMMAMMMKNRG
jgi:hypothetical protein